MSKLGRNEPCWCGSGVKYKKCHLNQDAVSKRKIPKFVQKIDPKVVMDMRAKNTTKEKRRISMQGKGRPIISTEINGYKIVTTGNKIHYSPLKNTKTFVDFLGNYINTLLTPEWGNAEISKSFEERHPVMQWYDGLCKEQRQYFKPDKVYELPNSGLVIAYNTLAYNLYLLDHNSEVQNHLLQRIKNKESFYAAYYETYVAAWFILAGFKLNLENETDPSTTHCEFVAEAPSGQRYSVEAKKRASGKNSFAFGNQLYKALKKRADYPRIVCIEMSLERDFIDDQENFQNEIVNRIRNKEVTLKIDGKPAPPAYVFISNISHHLHLHDDRGNRALLVDGFKINDFGYKQFRSLTDGYKARIKHSDIHGVAKAFERYNIPSTFNDELPEFAFGEEERRFIIGDRHRMDDGTIGTLRDGIVNESAKNAYLTYETDEGKHVLYKGPLSDLEISAYKRHPETFFGKEKYIGKTIEDPMEFYEFIYENHKETPREKLLQWFKNSVDYENIKNQSTEDILFLYAERHTLAFISREKQSENKLG